MTYGFAKTHSEKSHFEKHISVLFLLVILTFTFFVVLFTKTGTAEPEYECYKKLVSVQIESGDSLWSIANEYYSPECGDFRSYINEIKSTNNIKGDTIHSGCYILVPYYLYAETVH